ncbi:MAG TPA: twin-arginine translocation signal domain-containing protein [Bacteroides sp.]|nr:twin-arginine translocation signal domain-containing protein [Bacteroides sp.]
MKTTRRNFVKVASVAGAGLVTIGPIPLNSKDSKLRFLSPIDGDMLCEYDGKVKNGSLSTIIRISAPQGSYIRINGEDAKAADDFFFSEVQLKGYENVIEVEDGNSGEKQSIKVYWLKNWTNRYRLSLDDNIWFLKDISDHEDQYKSIFENPYLAFLKEVHDAYGAKIHVNIYYQTEGFNLSQMTTKFRNEWKENAGWLRLSFHALQNDPDVPYINAGYEQVKTDCDLVKDQIRRFAGEELMGPVTTLHWGEATVEGCRALRDSGYTALAGYFIDEPEEGQYPVSYYMTKEQRMHVNRRSIWRDNREDIIFSKIAIVINSYDLGEIIPYLDDYKRDINPHGFMDLMIHEQYFHSTYKDYQPDYREKVLTTVKWASENGYSPAFLSDCIFE